MYEFLFWSVTPILVIVMIVMFIFLQTNKIDNIGRARQLMKEAFEDDPYFKEGYISNIAMLLHDNHGITDYEKRNAAARDILHLVFWSE